MNWMISLIFLSLIPVMVFATTSVNCDDLGNSLVGNANITGLGQYDPILTFQNGKAVLRSSSSRVVAFKKEKNHTSVTFNRQIPVNNELIAVKETVDFITNEQGFVVSYLYDPKVAAQSQQSSLLGQKTTIKQDSAGLCNLEQFASLMKSNSEKPIEIVNQDRKYCSSVEDLLREMGKTSFDKCHDLLQKAAIAYNKRAQELAGEQKSFMESGTLNTMATTMASLNNCGPDEWYQTMNTPMGLQRILKASIAGKAKAPVKNSVKQVNVVN